MHKMWAVSTAAIFILAYNFMIANCSTGGSSISKGKTSKDSSTNLTSAQKERQQHKLIGDIQKCLNKSIEKMDSENAKKVTKVQEGIMSLLDAPFWKELQQKDGQLITLKEFHEKYESTLWGELVFVEIKNLWPVLSDYKGKLENIGKNANAEKLVEYKNVVKKEIHLKNAIEKHPLLFDSYSSQKKYEWKRKRDLELEKMAADTKKYIGEKLNDIPRDDRVFLYKVVELEGKISGKLQAIDKFFRFIKKKRIAAGSFGSISNDEIVLRVVGRRGEELKVTRLDAWLKKGNYSDRHYWLLDGTKDKFALNYVRSGSGMTPLEWMKQHEDFKDLESCAFSIDYQVKGDSSTRTVIMNLGEKGTMDFLRAKSGRFVVNAGKFFFEKNYALIQVDKNAWDEETSKA